MLRKEILEIQKRLVRQIKREIYSTVGKESPELERYYREYKNCTRDFIEPSTKKELVERIATSHIVYNGDYHTCKQSQKIPVRLLSDVLPLGRSVILCLEMFQTRDQSIIDEYMKGNLDDNEFLDRIEYHKTWGFPWNHYKPLLTFARDNKIRVVGLNSDPKGRKRIRKRDRHAANVIARQTVENPDSLIYVLFGDLHVAPSHLPSEVNAILSAHGIDRDWLVIYQNSERIYWKLAERDLEHKVDVVRVSDREYCVVNTTPLAKFQSYCNWEHYQEELNMAGPENWKLPGDGGVDFSEQTLQFIRTIARFFNIRIGRLDDLSIYMPGDVNFIKNIKVSLVDSSFAEDIALELQKAESYFLKEKNTIYLTNLSVNHAAQEATHFIHARCAPPSDRTPSLKDEFYARVLREGLGFLGSKIINHKRMCYKEKDFMDYLRDTRRKKLGDRALEIKHISRYVIKHLEMEKEFTKTGVIRWRIPKLYRESKALKLGIAHALGYMLGNKLYRAIVGDEISKEEIRNLFYLDYTRKGIASRTYFDLVLRLHRIKEPYKSKFEHL